MTTLRKLALPFGGVVLVAGALTLAVPKAAHGVAAALVQITNTAASPVITQGIGQQAAQIVHLTCGYAGANTVANCVQILPTGSIGTPNPYQAPSGQTLVITGVDILSWGADELPCMSSIDVILQVGIDVPPFENFLKTWTIPGGTGAAHYVYPTGFLVASGSPLLLDVTGCEVAVDLHGYLTPQ